MRQTLEDPNRLSPEDLQSVMQAAIARQGAAEQQAARTEEIRAMNSVEDALEIARQLDIPEEHVRAALRERERELLRPQRREQAQAKRRGEFIFSLIVAAAVTFGLAMPFLGLGSLLGMLLMSVWILPLLLGLRLLSPVSDRTADREELTPVAGLCRVCGAPAYNERATFCEEHRYKGPGR